MLHFISVFLYCRNIQSKINSSLDNRQLEIFNYFYLYFCFILCQHSKFYDFLLLLSKQISKLSTVSDYKWCGYLILKIKIMSRDVFYGPVIANH